MSHDQVLGGQSFYKIIMLISSYCNAPQGMEMRKKGGQIDQLDF
jgi:hypothetical protein